MSDSEIVVQLEPSLVPAAMRLNNAAGWNQTEQDWERVISIEPEGCFGLLVDGLLVSTATTVCYGGELAWIGMVLTDAACRGRGYARRLMECSMDFARRRGAAWIKLDATDMGRPLYLKLGFVDEAPAERWVGRAPADAASVELPPYLPDAALDREAFGADRTALIATLASGDAVSIPGEGFAMARPGTNAPYFGPCVCRTPGAARRYLQWFLGRHAGQAVVWDILPENREALRLAREFGFERRRELVRMACPGTLSPRPFARNDSYVFAIAAFEYG